MKNFLAILLVTLLIGSCTNTRPKNHLTFSGKIVNRTCDSIILKSFYKQKTSTIKLAADGSFKDTLKVIDGYYGLYIGDAFTKAFFQNGDDITMYVDFTNFDKTLSFSGKGAEEVNFLNHFYNTHHIIYEEEHLFDLSERDFITKLNYHFSKFKDSLVSDKSLDSTFVVGFQKQLKRIKKRSIKRYKENMYIKNQLGKGKPSPKFVNYTNFKEGKTSLDDLKGNYVYIDFWETACKPCIAEFPALENLITKYKGKNIKFVSIALMKRKPKEWYTYVSDNKLKGIQLLINKDNSFREAYKVSVIPRYLLIDPKGNIVDADAPKPSDPKLIALFNELKI